MRENLTDIIDKSKNGLKVINYNEKKVKSDSSFMSIIKGKYVLNNNKIIEREMIVKNIGAGNAVVVFAVDEDNQILLVIQPRTTLLTDDKVNVELPAGYIDNDESSIEAALRELNEETGYTSNNVMYLDSYYPSQGGSSERIDLIVALDCKKVSDQKLDYDEYVNYELVSFYEFEHLFRNNYMLDANIRIGFYEAMDYIEKYKFSKLISVLIEKGKYISSMESCTGGYLANCITNIDNSSMVFKYGTVTYSNEYKVKMGVDKEVINKFSVYSRECAREMACNISKYSNSNYGIGVTGTLKRYDINNDTVDNDLVYVCIYDRDINKYYDYEYRVYSDDREFNKRIIANYIVDSLIDII